MPRAESREPGGGKCKAMRMASTVSGNAMADRLLFLSRYKEGEQIHTSDTSTVSAAKDKPHDGERVALKRFQNAEQFERELTLRSEKGLDPSCVVGVLRSHVVLNGKEEIRDAEGQVVETRDWPNVPDTRCIVMPLGDRSLHHAIASENFVARDFKLVCLIA